MRNYNEKLETIARKEIEQLSFDEINSLSFTTKKDAFFAFEFSYKIRIYKVFSFNGYMSVKKKSGKEIVTIFFNSNMNIVGIKRNKNSQDGKYYLNRVYNISPMKYTKIKILKKAPDFKIIDSYFKKSYYFAGPGKGLKKNPEGVEVITKCRAYGKTWVLYSSGEHFSVDA